MLYQELSVKRSLYIVKTLVGEWVVVSTVGEIYLDIHLPTFLRGLQIINKYTSPIVVGFTNNSLYCFSYDYKQYLEKTPYIVQSLVLFYSCYSIRMMFQFTAISALAV